MEKAETAAAATAAAPPVRPCRAAPDAATPSAVVRADENLAPTKDPSHMYDSVLAGQAVDGSIAVKESRQHQDRNGDAATLVSSDFISRDDFTSGTSAKNESRYPPDGKRSRSRDAETCTLPRVARGGSLLPPFDRWSSNGSEAEWSVAGGGIAGKVSTNIEGFLSPEREQVGGASYCTAERRSTT